MTFLAKKNLTLEEINARLAEQKAIDLRNYEENQRNMRKLNLEKAFAQIRRVNEKKSKRKARDLYEDQLWQEWENWEEEPVAEEEVLQKNLEVLAERQPLRLASDIFTRKPEVKLAFSKPLKRKRGKTGK